MTWTIAASTTNKWLHLALLLLYKLTYVVKISGPSRENQFSCKYSWFRLRFGRSSICVAIWPLVVLSISCLYYRSGRRFEKKEAYNRA